MSERQQPEAGQHWTRDDGIVCVVTEVHPNDGCVEFEDVGNAFGLSGCYPPEHWQRRMTRPEAPQ